MRIQILAGDNKHIQFWPMNRLKNKLSDLGIKFVKSNPDMVLYHTYKASKSLKDKFAKTTAPVMILERIASARILSRKDIERDNVVGVLKSTVYRDLEIDNSDYVIETIKYPDKTFKNNYHSKLIYQSLNIPSNYHLPGKNIPKECFDKVELWYNFASYEMMLPYIKNKRSLNDNRKFDIGFIGTTQYGEHSDPITRHRKQCMQVLKKLSKCRMDISDKRVPGKSNYLNNIWDCKVGISPWGLGEKCYRDFEVIYGGGVLIKPDTSFVLDWIDSYNPSNKYYIPCRPDFSDLQEKVNMVKQKWNQYKSFRHSARKRLIASCMDDNKTAKHIHDVFTRCAGRIK